MSCQPSLTSGIFFLEFLAAILGLLVPVGWLTEFPEFPKQDIGLNAKPCISTCKMGFNPPGKRNKLRVRICRVGDVGGVRTFEVVRKSILRASFVLRVRVYRAFGQIE